MRAIVLGLMLTAVLGAPAQAERFAISCKGTMLAGIGSAQGMAGGPSAQRAIYVIDEDAQTIGHYLPKTRTLQDVCVFHLTCERSFSAERVTVLGGDYKGSGTSVRFEWDRGTGEIDIRNVLELENGNVMASRSTLKCVPTKMPKLAGA